jgi:hypothetical protein
MRITPLVAAGALIMAGGLAGEASAKPKPPITKTVAITAPVPDPSNWAGQGGVTGYSVCAQRIPSSFQTVEFKAPAIGKLKVTLTGFNGDWDVLVTDAKGTELTAGGSSGISTPAGPSDGDESATTKVKKANTVFKITACNWAGGPTGTLKYTFTYA